MVYSRKFFSLLSACLVIVLTGCSSGKQDLPSDAAAMVNGAKITKNEIEASVSSILQGYKAFGAELDSTRVDSLRNKLLDSVIERELLFQESKKAGIVVTEEDIAKEIETFSPPSSPGGEAFKKAMTSQGISEETLKKQYTRNIAIRKFIEDMVAKLPPPSPAEKAEYYEAHKQEFTHEEEVGARHVLVKTRENEPPDSLARKKAKIEELLARARNGEDFSTLASQYSDCPSASKGGDLGYFSRGVMVEAFEEVAFGLEEGELSGVVKTSYGFHIIQVYDRKAAGTDTFEEAEKSIDEALRRMRANDEVRALVDELKIQATIKIPPPSGEGG